MESTEKRIEKLEKQTNPPGAPRKLTALLAKLRGFKKKYGLGPDPTHEEVKVAISRMSSHSK